MDALAYIQGYAAREAAEGIEYDLSALQLFTDRPWGNLTSLTWLSTLSALLILSVLSVADPAAAQLLTQGMRGDAVAEVQTLLRNRGHAILYGPEGGGRGVFGPQTLTAVRSFQASAGLAVDGVVGPQTLTALRGGASQAPPTSQPQASLPNSTGNLRLGSTGDRVAELQTMLRNRGYTVSYGPDGSGRGRFDQNTLNAVRAFQQDAGLAVDGIAGPRTMAALQSSSPTVAAAPAMGGQVAAASFTSPGPGTYRVISGNSMLNVRSGPGTRFAVVRRLSNGSAVRVSDLTNANWAQIGPGEYVSRGYITPQ